jgi:hypothetical protein
MRLGVPVLCAFLLALILGAGGQAPARRHVGACGTTQVCPMDGRPMRDVVRFRVRTAGP